MERLKFFVLYSTGGKPEELLALGDDGNDNDCDGASRVTHRGQHSFEGVLPLPLPEFLVIFALGEWPDDDDPRQQMGAHVHLGKDLDPFSVGTLSKENRAVCWQGPWREDLHVRGVLMSEEGRPGYLIISPASPKTAAAEKEQCTAQADNLEPMETSQTESQSADIGEHHEGTEESSPPLLAVSRTDDKQTPSSAVRRQKVEVTPEVAVQLLSPPAMPHSGRKKRKSDTDGPVPRGQSRVKRLQMQQNPPSLNVKKDTHFSRMPSKTGSDGSVPSARWGHSMCAISKTQAVVIGGQGENQVLSKDSVWLLDTDNVKWWIPGIPQVDSTKPQYRMGHTAVYDPKVKCVYVYGGSKNLRWYSDVHVLDVESWRWSLVKASGRAPTRAYHSSTLYNDEMYIFGGVYPNPDPEPDGCSDRLHVFSPASESWYEPLVMGKKPKARSGHSATLLGDRLVIIGGWDAPECFNDVHCLDLSLMDFTCIQVKGTPPSPRSWHASAALPGNRILIQGGFDGENAMTDSFVFCLDTECWTKLLWPFHASPTAGHTILAINRRDGPFSDDSDDKENETLEDNDRKQKLFIFGGGNNEGTFSNKLVSFKLQLPSDP